MKERNQEHAYRQSVRVITKVDTQLTKQCINLMFGTGKPAKQHVDSPIKYTLHEQSDDLRSVQREAVDRHGGGEGEGMNSWWLSN